MTDNIIDDDTPMAAPQGTWSLFDLIASIVSVILCLGMLITIAGGRKEDDEEKEPSEDEKSKIKRRTAIRIASLIPAIAAVVLFLVTQDLTQQMVIFDKWSVVFGIIAVVSIVMAIASRKKQDGNDDEQQPTA